jgi:SAM-dependent methyltransferase
MYDEFSSDYDRFVSWPGRLAYEMPFLLDQTWLAAREGQPCRVLDTACGTGMHAIELAKRGASAVGTDLSAGMISRAKANVQAAGLELPFFVAGFTNLMEIVPEKYLPFDLLTCLGNSLPHVGSFQELEQALETFGRCLRAGGRLVLQNRNFDAVMAQRSRWMEPQSHREGEAEWVFVRFYDFEPDGSIQFHILTLKRSAGKDWQQSLTSTRLLPLRQVELVDALKKVGFSEVVCFGDLAGAPFNPEKSGNLVISAVR